MRKRLNGRDLAALRSDPDSPRSRQLRAELQDPDSPASHLLDRIADASGRAFEGSLLVPSSGVAGGLPSQAGGGSVRRVALLVPSSGVAGGLLAQVDAPAADPGKADDDLEKVFYETVASVLLADAQSQPQAPDSAENVLLRIFADADPGADDGPSGQADDSLSFWIDALRASLSTEVMLGDSGQRDLSRTPRIGFGPAQDLDIVLRKLRALMDKIDDPLERQVAIRKLKRLTNEEIANDLDIVRGEVDQKVEVFRDRLRAI